MKIATLLVAFLLLAPAAPVIAQETPPPGLAELERARSHMCVPALAELHRLDEVLDPLFRRADRIQALNVAISLEDSLRVAPFDDSDPVERAVREWFDADYQLALDYVAGGEETIQERRSELKEEMRGRLQEALEPLRGQVEEILDSAGDLDVVAGECDDVVLVRSAVLEVCETVESPVCDDARTPEPQGRYALVDTPEDLWGMDQLRPWSDPVPLHRTLDGALAGARTVTTARRGNLVLAVALEPMIQARSELSAEDIAEHEAHMDSLGFSFEHPDFVMVPALTIHLNLGERLGGETHYILHFGNLSNPVDDVIWTTTATGSGAIDAVTVPAGWILAALAAGDPVTFSAIRVIEAGVQAEVAFFIELAPVGQIRATSALLSYMATGQLGQDLMELFPPSAGGDGR